MGGKAPGSTTEARYLDELFSVLADERCRSTLTYLHNSSVGVAEVDELVTHVVGATSTADEEQVAIQFHHVILPRLEDTGFIEYDDRSGTVRYRSQPNLERVLQAVKAETIA